MCIICICKDKKLTDKELENCWHANSHGAGVAWAKNGKVQYKKGFDKLVDLKAFYETVDVLPHILHFRTGTSGGYSQQMTHPFVIDDDGSLDLEYTGDKSILFHNGVISDWKEMALTYFLSNSIKIPQGAWSDTRVLAVLCSRLGYGVLDFIYGKFTILHPNGIIERYGEFTLDEGNYYSNSDYKERSYGYGSTYYANSGGGSSFRGLEESSETKSSVSAKPHSSLLGTAKTESDDYLSERELTAIEEMMLMCGTEKEEALALADKKRIILKDTVSDQPDWMRGSKWVISRDSKISRKTWGDY